MNCIFCDLMSSNDAATRWVHHGPLASAFLTRDTGALAPGHTLVIPTNHFKDIQSIDAEALTACILLAKTIALAMRSELGATGVNLLNASGPGSEQSVNHFHLHVVPRWEDDGFTTWPSQRSLKESQGNLGAILKASLESQAALG